MINTKKYFTNGLLHWNRTTNERPMPWKGEKEPYKIWLSEIILQQTRVEQGWDYYNRFVKAFPTIEQLAKAPETKVFKLWEGLGYYTRCKNLVATAKIITTTYRGRFPDQYQDILALKVRRHQGLAAPQQGDLVWALRRQIDQLFLEDPLDPVPAAVNGADLGHLPGRFHDPPQCVVDDRGWAARLGDDHIFGHGCRLVWIRKEWGRHLHPGISRISRALSRDDSESRTRDTNLETSAHERISHSKPLPGHTSLISFG